MQVLLPRSDIYVQFLGTNLPTLIKFVVIKLSALSTSVKKLKRFMFFFFFFQISMVLNLYFGIRRVPHFFPWITSKQKPVEVLGSFTGFCGVWVVSCDTIASLHIIKSLLS